MGLEYLWKRSGPLSMAPSQLGAFTRSDPQQPYPNIQYHVQPLSLDAFGSPLHTFNAITASVCNLNPTSRGTVEIKTPDFRDAPAISPNYLSTDADRKVAADSLRMTRRIVSQKAFERFGLARRRCRCDAPDYQRQHQLPHPHDCRKSRPMDCRRQPHVYGKHLIPGTRNRHYISASVASAGHFQPWPTAIRGDTKKAKKPRTTGLFHCRAADAPPWGGGQGTLDASRGRPIGAAAWPLLTAAISSSLGYLPSSQ